jgi:hypothetical protein
LRIEEGKKNEPSCQGNFSQLNIISKSYPDYHKFLNTPRRAIEVDKGRFSEVHCQKGE